MSAAIASFERLCVANARAALEQCVAATILRHSRTTSQISETLSSPRQSCPARGGTGGEEDDDDDDEYAAVLSAAAAAAAATPSCPPAAAAASSRGLGGSVLRALRGVAGAVPKPSSGAPGSCTG